MKIPESIQNLLNNIQPLQDKLYLVALFGSYARGEENKDSDIDVLLVSKSKDAGVKNKIVELVDGAMASVGYDELLSPVIMDLGHFNEIKRQNTDLYYFVNKEGKILWQTAS